MISHVSNQWSYAIPFLAMHYRDQRLGGGSCFFWTERKRTYLVTNWHNLAGRNHLTGKVLKQQGGIPDRVYLWLFKRVSPADHEGYFELEYGPVEVPIGAADGTPLWLEHPILGSKIDVAAIDVTEHTKGFEIAYVNQLESDAVGLDLRATQEVYVVGFPFGQLVNAPAPIWKRGSIALDPMLDPDNLPKMLLDTATREGMSGSVVLARHIIVGRDYLRKTGTRSPKVLYGVHDTVVGIYSGRHYPDLERAQLGIVWKRSTIEETIAARRIAQV